MKKNIYVKPTVNIIEVGTESQLMAGSNGINNRTGLDNGFGQGGQSDGTVEINAKNNKYSIWGYDEDED